MRKSWKVTMVTGVAVVLATMVAAGPAVAGTSAPRGYGFDNTSGRDRRRGFATPPPRRCSTSRTSTSPSAVNNGCPHVTGSAVRPQQNHCDGTTDRPFNHSNWDGDTVGEANPTGSGAGRQAMDDAGGTGNYEGTVNKVSNPGTVEAATATNGCDRQRSVDPHQRRRQDGHRNGHPRPGVRRRRCQRRLVPHLGHREQLR